MSETVSANDFSTSDSDLTEPSAYPFVLPPEQPSMTGPCGIRYDFNDGARVLLPEGRWRVLPWRFTTPEEALEALRLRSQRNACATR